MSEDKNSSGIVAKIVIALSVIIAGLSLYILLAFELPDKPIAGQGGNIDETVSIGGDFTLTDHNGKVFNSDMIKGKLSLIYFGFTFCPDICPTSLQKLTDVLSTLDKYKIDVQPIFITIDPARDKPELLKEYLSHFHPNFIGLTGSNDEIKRVADLYKVYYAIAQDSKDVGNKYMLDHTSFIYLMDRNGKYMKHFYMSSTPEEIIEYIRIHG